MQAERVRFNMFDVEYLLVKATASLVMRQGRGQTRKTVQPRSNGQIKTESKTLESYYREHRETTRGKPGDKVH